MPTYRPWRWATPFLVVALFGAGTAPDNVPGPSPRAPAITLSAPATAPELSSGYSTPSAAVTDLVTALHEGNFAAARDALIIPTDQKPALDALLDAMAATARLQKAASARFLSADIHFKPPTAADLADKLQRVAAARQTVNGDSATLDVPSETATLPAANLSGAQPAAQTLELKKIGVAWKGAGPSFFSLTGEPADRIATRVALARKLAAVADDMAGEIAAGKYFSEADAYQEYWTRCLRATATAPSNSAPATASAPASISP
jgi:hypothetical protein